MSDWKASTETLMESISSVTPEELGENDRQALLSSAQQLCHRLETPWEALQRLVWHQPAQIAALKTCVDLDLFAKWLSSESTEKTAEELCELLGNNSCDPKLLVRLLRLLAETGLLKNPAPEKYTLTPLTVALAKDPAFPAAFRYLDHIQSKVLSALPAFLACLHYRNPSNADLTCFQYALQSPLPVFAWLRTQPEDQKDFGQLMKAYAGMQTPWVDIYPTEVLAATNRETVLVDVGGGVGHDILHFARKHADLASSRLVLQDQTAVVGQAVVTPELATAMAHDFFTPQPIKGAAAYYLHSVLHDWPDVDARKILKHLHDAMEPDCSRLLLHEIVLHDQLRSVDAAASDIIMMATLGAEERSEKSWRSLLHSEGFRIEKIHQSSQSRQSVIEAIMA